jgi:hypothetical protein
LLGPLVGGVAGPADALLDDVADPAHDQGLVGHVGVDQHLARGRAGAPAVAVAPGVAVFGRRGGVVIVVRAADQAAQRQGAGDGPRSHQEGATRRPVDPFVPSHGDRR